MRALDCAPVALFTELQCASAWLSARTTRIQHKERVLPGPVVNSG
jgi:hypothetical protein